LFNDMSIRRHLKSYFFRGLAVLLPTILTIGIFVWGYGFIRDKISAPINRQIVNLHFWLGGMKGNDALDKLTRFWVDGWGQIAGFVLALIIVFIVGALLASVVGKALWRLVERFIMNTPLLRRVYPYVKQVTDFFLTQEEQESLFSRVVAVEYPRKGIWSVGFVTGSGIEKVMENSKKEFLTVLIPTSPTPFTGFIIIVPKKQTIALDMTVEEALRFTVSAGVITPLGGHEIVLPEADLENKG